MSEEVQNIMEKLTQISPIVWNTALQNAHFWMVFDAVISILFLILFVVCVAVVIVRSRNYGFEPDGLVVVCGTVMFIALGAAILASSSALWRYTNLEFSAITDLCNLVTFGK